MGSEKAAANPVLVRFGSIDEAARRVAGVAAVARLVHRLGGEGHDRIWVALPAGETLPAAAMADIERLAGTAAVEIVDADSLPAEALDAPVAAHVALTTSGVLKATGKAGDGPVSRWLNRPVSRQISAALLRWPGLRPIHATFGTALIAAVMFAFLVGGGAAGLVVGGLLFHAASVFDGVDGEVARATFRTSAAGAAIDTVVDMATNLLFVVGLTANLAVRGVPNALVAGGWGLTLFVIGLAALSWGAARAGGPFSLDLMKHSYRRRFPGRFASLVVAFGTVVTSRDFAALVSALLLLAGLPMAVLYIFAAAATLWFLLIPAALVPRLRQRSA